MWRQVLKILVLVEITTLCTVDSHGRILPWFVTLVVLLSLASSITVEYFESFQALFGNPGGYLGI